MKYFLNDNIISFVFHLHPADNENNYPFLPLKSIILARKIFFSAKNLDKTLI